MRAITQKPLSKVHQTSDPMEQLKEQMGNIKDLQTNEKGNVVEATNELLRRLIVTDTCGVIGNKGEEVEAQALIDEIAEKVMEKLLLKTGDSANNIVKFESGDNAKAQSWTAVDVMETEEKHKSLFGKISTMFRNVRFLYWLLGKTDISKIQDGTVTGILKELKQVAFSGSYVDLTEKPEVVSKSSDGFVPQLPNETTTKKYLRQDGTWEIPPDTNTQAVSSVNNKTGAVTLSAEDIKAVPASGKITKLNNISQITGIGFWAIAEIDNIYAASIGIDNNVGDFYAMVLSYNGNSTKFNFGTIILSSPRINGFHYEIQVWEGTAHAERMLNFSDITNSAAVNVAGKKALDAIEKNASVAGTLANQLQQVNSKLANYTYTGINGGDANTIKTEYHKFVFNMSNLPEAYGFLDVSKFGGDGFSPSPAGVIRQQFTGWNTGKNYTRCQYGSTWTAWIEAAKSEDIAWKTVSLSGVDTEISTTGKTINLPDSAKTAKEIMVSTEVGGAVELKRVLTVIPGLMDWNGSYVCRETQIASIWIQYAGGTLTYGAFMLQGFIPYISGILYR